MQKKNREREQKKKERKYLLNQQHTNSVSENTFVYFRKSKKDNFNLKQEGIHDHKTEMAGDNLKSTYLKFLLQTSQCLNT